MMKIGKIYIGIFCFLILTGCAAQPVETNNQADLIRYMEEQNTDQKYCSVCGRHFPASVKYCSKDGSLLKNG